MKNKFKIGDKVRRQDNINFAVYHEGLQKGEISEIVAIYDTTLMVEDYPHWAMDIDTLILAEPTLTCDTAEIGRAFIPVRTDKSAYAMGHEYRRTTRGFEFRVTGSGDWERASNCFANNYGDHEVEYKESSPTSKTEETKVKNLNLTFPSTERGYEAVTVTVSASSPYPTIKAGCFTGGYSAAVERTRGRQYYTDILNQIEVTCAALNIQLEEQFVTVTLTAAEAQLLSDISNKTSGSPTKSRRGLTASVGDKVRLAMLEADISFTQFETEDIKTGLRFYDNV